MGLLFFTTPHATTPDYVGLSLALALFLSTGRSFTNDVQKKSLPEGILRQITR